MTIDEGQKKKDSARTSLSTQIPCAVIRFHRYSSDPFPEPEETKKKLKERKTDSQRAGWLRPFAIKLKTADAAAAAGFLVSFWRCTQVLRGRGTPSSSAARKKANKQASKRKSNTKKTATNLYQDTQQHSRGSSILENGPISLPPPPTQFITLKSQKKATLSV
jgi:hypothetical protein